MFSNPQHWHNLLYLGGGAAGYTIGHAQPSLTVLFDAVGGIALIVVASVLVIGNEYGMAREKDKEVSSFKMLDRTQAERDAVFAARAAGVKESKPPVNVFKQGPMLVRSQDVVVPQFDKEREIARVLNDQRVSGFKMDISETFWIRDGHWKGLLVEFRAIRSKWEYYKIVGKRGTASNSPYDVLNEQAVELIAMGRVKLPPPPEMV